MVRKKRGDMDLAYWWHGGGIQRAYAIGYWIGGSHVSKWDRNAPGRALGTTHHRDGPTAQVAWAGGGLLLLVPAGHTGPAAAWGPAQSDGFPSAALRLADAAALVGVRNRKTRPGPREGPWSFLRVLSSARKPAGVRVLGRYFFRRFRPKNTGPGDARRSAPRWCIRGSSGSPR